jgi:hypothetical protein
MAPHKSSPNPFYFVCCDLFTVARPTKNYAKGTWIFHDSFGSWDTEDWVII